MTVTLTFELACFPVSLSPYAAQLLEELLGLGGSNIRRPEPQSREKACWWRKGPGNGAHSGGVRARDD